MTGRSPRRGEPRGRGGGRGRRPPREPAERRPPARGRTFLWLVLILVIVVAAGWALARDAIEGGGSEDPPVAETVTGETTSFLIREGLRREDVAEHLESETDLSGERYLELTGPGARGRALAGTGRPTSLEGYLFPATYEIGPETTVRDLVDDQVQAFKVNTSEVDFGYAKQRNLTEHEVITIASMIEREAAVPDERRKVASVIYNRLREGMLLGIDATVQYALGEWTAELTAEDLDIDSPYNTRKVRGLPPGPIASPGLDSIRAAAQPVETDLLYYVARNDGTGRHYFSTNASDFERDVQRARQNGGGT